MFKHLFIIPRYTLAELLVFVFVFVGLALPFFAGLAILVLFPLLTSLMQARHGRESQRLYDVSDAPGEFERRPLTDRQAHDALSKGLLIKRAEVPPRVEAAQVAQRDLDKIVEKGTAVPPTVEYSPSLRTAREPWRYRDRYAVSALALIIVVATGFVAIAGPFLLFP